MGSNLSQQWAMHSITVQKEYVQGGNWGGLLSVSKGAIEGGANYVQWG